MSAPVHSVIMPVLNGITHVREGVDSALAALGRDDELIVVDNGSSDGTQEMVRGMGDPRIVLLSEQKRGPAAARNRGLAVARGKYISFHDHDDLWPAGRLDAMVARLARSPGADAVYGRFKMRFDGEVDTHYTRIDGRTLPGLAVSNYLLDAQLVRLAGPMDESLMYGEDTDYILKLQSIGMSAIEYDGIAVIYRRHLSNMTRNRDDAQRSILAVLARNIARRRAQN